MHWLLVLAATGDPNVQVGNAVWKCQSEFLRQQYTAAGLLDCDDTEHFLFTWRVDYDTGVMSQRAEYLADHPDLPPTADGRRFPPTDACWDAVQLSRLFLSYLEEIEPFAVGDEVGDIADLRWDTERRIEIWQACESVQTNWSGWKRQKLSELRRLLGPDDYAAGRMPHPLPVAAQNGRWTP